jgi:histidinol-phosphate phosphatase family protein
VTRPTVVFLDRDGTIIRDVEYLSKPEQVELLPGAAHAIRRLNDAGIPVVVATNQSGIARGFFTTEDYLRGEARLAALLGDEGAHIDATYFCPHLPTVTGPCDCRKPALGMFTQAARDLSLDMSSPAFIGDRWRDIAASGVLGGTGILIASRDARSDDVAHARDAGLAIVPSLADAVDSLLGRA